MILVEAFLSLSSILELALRVLPRLFGLKVARIYLSWLAFGFADKLLLVPFSEAVLVVHKIKAFLGVYQLLVLTLVRSVES